MHKSDEKYQAYVKILEEELIPAMGCTEPIAIAYAGAVARKTLGNLPEQLDIKVSGNIIKNVKSVIVPNTGGMRGIAAALCAGVIAGDAEALLEVIARVTPGQKEEIKSYMDQVKPKITPASTGHVFEIDLTVTQGTETARVRIVSQRTTSPILALAPWARQSCWTFPAVNRILSRSATAAAARSMSFRSSRVRRC